MAIDITTGKFHESAMKYVAFNEIAAGLALQTLISKDVTIGQGFIIEKVVLSCLTGHVYIFDGSAAGGAVPIFGLDGGGGDITMGVGQQVWDFKGDPVEFTRDSTSLCISAAGTFNGFIKYGWSTLPASIK